ncbi:MAG: zinc carboxypeptidase [Erysipelotrichaceae bacterium]|jgi:hypothetical protein|nr:zinc carboxypeptidase [Erysipelotrichaceae bacterium]
MKVTNKYDHYAKYAEVTDLLQKYASDFPGYTRLSSLATSKEGREIWLLEITDLSTGDFSEKPGYFLNGHVHAGEVSGTMTTLYFLDALFTNLKSDRGVSDLLKNTTFYVIPRPVVDGAEYYLTTPDTLRSVNEYYPYQEDQDGIIPKDLDGDGVIRTMLVKSPYGVWKKEKDDPRILTRRLPDDIKGVFYNAYMEGLIKGYKGEEPQPAPAKYGLDLNRNFPYKWETANIQQGSGFYALDRQESRTLAEFVISHRNICATINMHTSGRQYLYPPGTFSKKEANQDDMKRYDVISKIAGEETGYTPMNIKDDYLADSPGRVTGSFDDFLHFANGIFSFTIEIWNAGQQAGLELGHPDPYDKKTPAEILEMHKKFFAWIDSEGYDKYVKAWTPYNHPQLGEVEIGGIEPKYFIQNPPFELLEQEVERHTRFILRHAKMLPHLVFKDAKSEEVSPGVFRIFASLYNSGYLPSSATNEFVTLGLAEDIEVSISAKAKDILQGDKVQKIGQLEGFSGVRSEIWGFRPFTAKHNPVEKQIEWIVSGKAGDKLTLSASSQRAGKAKIKVTL